MVRLTGDAELWLTYGQGSVRTVILIKTNPRKNSRGVINRSRQFTCQIWYYGGVEEVTGRRSPHLSIAEPEFKFGEDFCEGQVRIPFHDLVEERPNDSDRSHFVLTPDNLMGIARHANALRTLMRGIKLMSIIC